MPELVSTEIRYALREFCVNCVSLRHIADAFESAGFTRSDLPSSVMISGERRSLVEEYYQGVNWNNPSDAQLFIRALNSILSQFYIDDESAARLLSACRRAGLIVDGRQVRLGSTVRLDWVLTNNGQLDREIFDIYCTRISGSIHTDPDGAVGASKELVEAVAKYVLRNTDHLSSLTEFPRLVKAAITELSLSRDDIPDSAKGAKAIQQTLSAFNQIVDGLARLRSLYGSGHGRARIGGLRPRHARLAAGAAITLSAFMLDTLEERPHPTHREQD